MTKQFRSARVPLDADQLRQVAAEASHSVPPAVVRPQRGERRTVLVNIKMDEESAIALAEAAEAAGMTQKQFVCTALKAAGVVMQPHDLEDRSPRRRVRRAA
jgi:hypothetical protein